MTPAAVPPAAPPPDLAPLLAELDDLAERAAALRLRLAAAGGRPSGRPGWPIRRVAGAAVG